MKEQKENTVVNISVWKMKQRELFEDIRNQNIAYAIFCGILAGVWLYINYPIK